MTRDKAHKIVNDHNLEKLNELVLYRRKCAQKFLDTRNDTEHYEREINLTERKILTMLNLLSEPRVRDCGPSTTLG